MQGGLKVVDSHMDVQFCLVSCNEPAMGAREHLLRRGRLVVYGLAVHGLDVYDALAWKYGEITALADRIQKLPDGSDDGADVYVCILVKCRQRELVVL